MKTLNSLRITASAALAAFVILTANPPPSAIAAEPWTLDSAINYALEHSPDARIALHRIAAAQAGVQQANAAFWPQLQLQGGYSRTDTPANAFATILNQGRFSPTLNFNDPGSADNLQARGVLNFTLYNGGRDTANRDAASARREGALQQNDSVRQTLAFEVARAFHTVLKAREFIRSASAAVSGFETNRAIAEKRLNASTILKSELLDVEVRLAQSREDLVRARNAHALAERALRNLLGIESGEFAVAGTTPVVAAPNPSDPPRRAELLAAQSVTRTREAELRAARGGYRPRVNAFTSYEYDRGFDFRGSGNSYSAGIAAQWDIFDGKLTAGKISAAEAEFVAAREEERKLRLGIDLEIEQARLALAAATERLAVTDKTIAQATESVALTRARFEQGIGLST
jgi:outer membrane protein TolC